MSKKVHVLIFPCGSENAAEIHDALKYSVHVELFGASSVEDHGRYTFEHYIGGVPNIRSTGFDDFFSALVAELKIDVVFATHDTVIDYLAPRAQAMGVFLVNGAPETTAIARKKSATYRLFADCTWVPRVFASIEEIEDWPVVVKPDCGQGGQCVTVAQELTEARAAVAKVAEPVLVEYLPGDEITVDCFTDKSRTLIWVGPRTRERVKAGISMRSRVLEQGAEFEVIASTINERLTLRGPWFFQLKRDKNGKWKLLEISCRVAGAMVTQRARGVNLPLMAIQDYLGRQLVALPNQRVSLIERKIATRAELDIEYDTIFVDLDDTLIINGFATPLVLAFLYQSVRAGKKIKLITRHALDVAETLQSARISIALFDEIIHLRDGTSKADYVTERAVFIDNHFPERYDVATRKHIPVLDVDALEFFMR